LFSRGAATGAGLPEPWIFSLHDVPRDRWLPDGRLGPFQQVFFFLPSFCWFLFVGVVMFCKGQLGYVLRRTQDVHAKEMQRCKVHTLQVNPFWGRQVLVRALCMLITPAERLRILNYSQTCTCRDRL